MCEDSRGKSPLRRHGSDYRVGQRADITGEITTLKEDQPINEYERPRRVQKEEDYSQKYLDDDIYQPKILPRPQPRDKLEDLNGIEYSIACNLYSDFQSFFSKQDPKCIEDRESIRRFSTKSGDI